MATDFTRTWRTAATRTTAARKTAKGAATRTNARKRAGAPGRPTGRDGNGQAPPARGEPAGSAPGTKSGSSGQGTGRSSGAPGTGSPDPGRGGRSAGSGGSGRAEGPGGRVVRAATTAAPAVETSVSGGGGGGGGRGGRVSVATTSTAEAVVRTPTVEHGPGTLGRDGHDWPAATPGSAPGAGKAPMNQRMSKAQALARGREMAGGRGRPGQSRTGRHKRMVRRRPYGMSRTKPARRGLLKLTPLRLILLGWMVAKWPFHMMGVLLILCLVFVVPAFFSLGGTSERNPIEPAASALLRVNWDPKVCETLPVPENRVCTYGPLFNAAGEAHDIDPRLLAAVAYAESHYRTDIIDCSTPSEDGALGIMQFLPSTAAEQGVDPCDPVSAIPGAAEYLRQLYDELGSWQLAMAGYHAGGGAVRAAGNQIPPFPKTQAYVRDVQAKWSQYQKLFPATSGSGCEGTSRRGTTDLQETPHVTRTLRSMYEAVVSCFGREHSIGCYQERAGDKFEHPRGRACDFMITSGGKADGDRKAHGQAMAEYVMANAQELDVLYVIWFGKIWMDGDKPGQPWEEWDDYNGGGTNGDPSGQHTNHVHVSVHWAEGDPPWAKCSHSRCTN